MKRKHMIVRLHDGGGDLRSGRHGEGELGLAAVVDGQALQKEGAETRAGSSACSVEDHESLETGAVISQLPDAVQDEINDLLADGVVATGIIVGGILFARNHLLGMVQLAVGSGADLVTHSRLEVDHDATRNVLAGSSLGEEGVEGIITTTDGLVGRHLTIRLNAVLKTVQLPAPVSGLDTTLTNMNRKTLSHCCN